MSYCRFGWDGSDVYVFETGVGQYECCGCRLLFTSDRADEDPTQNTPRGMVKHLRRHRRAGHVVPQYAIDRLMCDAMDDDGLRLRDVPWLLWWMWRGHVVEPLKREKCARVGHRDRPAIPDGGRDVSMVRACGRCGATGYRIDGETRWMDEGRA
jgi:hypothetical protein